jgi:hypothetical protein
LKSFAANSHSLLTEFWMPGNSAYQQVQLAITPTSGDMIECGRRYWVSLAVAGTMIDTYSLYGVWSAGSFLDGATSPQAITSFDITP